MVHTLIQEIFSLTLVKKHTVFPEFTSEKDTIFPEFPLKLYIFP